MKACFAGTRTKPISLKTIETIKTVKDCELSITEEAMRQTDPVIGLEFIKQCGMLNITIKIDKSPEQKLKDQGVELMMDKRTPKELVAAFKEILTGLDPSLIGSYTASELGQIFNLDTDKMADFAEGAEAREDDEL